MITSIEVLNMADTVRDLEKAMRELEKSRSIVSVECCANNGFGFSYDKDHPVTVAAKKAAIGYWQATTDVLAANLRGSGVDVSSITDPKP